MKLQRIKSNDLEIYIEENSYIPNLDYLSRKYYHLGLSTEINKQYDIVTGYVEKYSKQRRMISDVQYNITKKCIIDKDENDNSSEDDIVVNIFCRNNTNMKKYAWYSNQYIKPIINVDLESGSIYL